MFIFLLKIQKKRCLLYMWLELGNSIHKTANSTQLNWIHALKWIELETFFLNRWIVLRWIDRIFQNCWADPNWIKQNLQICMNRIEFTWKKPGINELNWIELKFSFDESNWIEIFFRWIELNWNFLSMNRIELKFSFDESNWIGHPSEWSCPALHVTLSSNDIILCRFFQIYFSELLIYIQTREEKKTIPSIRQTLHWSKSYGTRIICVKVNIHTIYSIQLHRYFFMQSIERIQFAMKVRSTNLNMINIR
jgi:hypothetical protein